MAADRDKAWAELERLLTHVLGRERPKLGRSTWLFAEELVENREYGLASDVFSEAVISTGVLLQPESRVDLDVIANHLTAGTSSNSSS